MGIFGNVLKDPSPMFLQGSWEWTFGIPLREYSSLRRSQIGGLFHCGVEMSTCLQWVHPHCTSLRSGREQYNEKRQMTSESHRSNNRLMKSGERTEKNDKKIWDFYQEILSLDEERIRANRICSQLKHMDLWPSDYTNTIGMVVYWSLVYILMNKSRRDTCKRFVELSSTNA